MKWIIRIVLILVVVVLLGVIAGFVFIDQITGTAIRKGSAYATGVETSLASADVGVFSGELTLSELVIGNPEGYELPTFFELGHGHVDVSLGSLMGSDTIEIPNVTLSEITLQIEKKDGKANFQVILDNLEKLSGESEAESEPKEAGRSLAINELRLENITVVIKGYPAPSPIKIDAIVLNNVPEDATSGATIADVTGIVIVAVIKSTLNNVAGLPDELVESLNAELADVGKLGQQAIAELGDVAGQAAEQLGEAAGEATKAIDEAANKANEELQKATEGLGDLFPGQKKDEESEE